MFSRFAKWMSKKLGDSKAFITALVLIILWFAGGLLFGFTNSWLLLIDTVATIVTFLMVFVIQNTQNRDIMAIHLKLDELIRAMQGTHNELLKVEQLTDEELEELLRRYENLAAEVKTRIRAGHGDLGTPEA